MRAAYIESFAPKNNLKIGNLPEPIPKIGEVCIAVAYAGVNPVDAKIAEGLIKKRLPHQFPIILGWEASGRIHSLGKGVTTYKVGDRVYLYCRKPIVQGGAWAEYVTYPAKDVARVPESLTLRDAAAIPLAGLTAWQALFEKTRLKPEEAVLIHAGGGGVGGYAIQWASYCGASPIITTASRSKFDYVKHLGAEEAIDYKADDFVEEIRGKYPFGIDVVLDTVGKNIYKKSFEVLKPGGRIVSLLEEPDESLARSFNVEAEYLFVTPNGRQLQEIATLFEKGKALLPEIQEMPLDWASYALDIIRGGHTKGKIVLKI